MLISYCINILNRRAQLEQTLRANLDEIASFDAELVLVDLGSDDGVDAWIERTFADAIANGKLRFFREYATAFFHASRTKNISHRLARGVVLMNLDADNYIDGTTQILDAEFTRSPDVVVHMLHEVGDGSYGRIALHRDAFARMGGYDESLAPVGGQDMDLLVRARLAGLTVVDRPHLGRPAIENDKEETLRNTSAPSTSWNRMNAFNMRRSRERAARGEFRANLGGWGFAVTKDRVWPTQSMEPQLAEPPLPGVDVVTVDCEAHGLDGNGKRIVRVLPSAIRYTDDGGTTWTDAFVTRTPSSEPFPLAEWNARIAETIAALRSMWPAHAIMETHTIPDDADVLAYFARQVRRARLTVALGRAPGIR